MKRKEESRFAKTGSGQQWENLSETVQFAGPHPVRCGGVARLDCNHLVDAGQAEGRNSNRRRQAAIKNSRRAASLTIENQVVG